MRCKNSPAFVAVALIRTRSWPGDARVRPYPPTWEEAGPVITVRAATTDARAIVRADFAALVFPSRTATWLSRPIRFAGGVNRSGCSFPAYKVEPVLSSGFRTHQSLVHHVGLRVVKASLAATAACRSQ
jgi:hypothetical protein